MSERAEGDRRKLLEDALRQLRDARARLEAAERARHEPIAVIGAGVRLPGDVNDVDAFWRLLRDGRDAVSRLGSTVDGCRAWPEDGPADGRWAGLLSEVAGFDAGFFGISADEADRLDPQQRLVLEVAWEALEDAGLPVERVQGSKTGVFIGLYGSDYVTLQLSDTDSIGAYTGPGSAHSIAANRLSYLLDLHGPSLAVDTACSSSLVAVSLACRALRAGDCDLAFVGGVNVILSPLSTLVTEKVLPLAPSGRCRTFDAAADGIVRGEGCGVLLLERMSAARSAGRRLRGVIRGTAVNQDGRTNGLTAPNPRAQSDVLRQALDDAAVDPRDVLYVEAHGTGTPLGDPIEVEALRDVYGQGEKPCALGAVKSNLGHLEAAAGVAGLVKTMLVLERGKVPPNLHLERVNPEIDLRGTRFTVPTTLTPLPVGVEPRLATVSSFGFGGTNAHAVLEAPPAGEERRPPGASPESLLLPVSARSEGALAELARRYSARLQGCDAAEAAEVCAAAALHRSHHPHRVCASGSDPAQMVRQLEVAASVAASAPSGGMRRVAFVFSGQGSQWAGMGCDLLAREPVARDEIEACDTVARTLTGWSIIEQLQASKAESRLNETEVAQLAIAALELGLAALWRSWGVAPYAVAGHSMGEVVAACAAGALDRSQAFHLLLARARITERAARGGAMASIELPAADVERLVAASAGRVGIAAVNGPRSTVVAGDRFVTEAVVSAAAAQGAVARPMPVEYAFHSPLLDGCAEELAAAVTDLGAQEGDAALYSTVTAARVALGQLDAAHWGRNLREAVLFGPTIASLARDGVSVFVEVGPHPVLLRDMGATLEELGTRHVTVGSLRRGRPAVPALHRSLADLYAAGVSVTWERVVAGPRTHPSLPPYPWQRRRHWISCVAEPATREGNGGDKAKDQANGVPTAPKSYFRDVPSEERVQALLLYVRKSLVAALEYSSIDDVPADLPLEELGLDSLTIVELKNQLEREAGVVVPLQVLLEGGSPADLARAVADALSEVDADEASAPDATARLTALAREGGR